MAAGRADPAGGPEVTPLVEADLERRRATSGLAPLVPGLMRSLQPVIDAGQLVVVADVEGRVLWRSGSSAVRRMADGLGFVGGSAWTEGNVGTNAIGTALVLGVAGAHPGRRALRRVAHPLGMRGRSAVGPVDRSRRSGSWT